MFCTPQRQSSLAITFPLVNHHQPTASMADHLNALPDPPARAEAQQELEPIAEPAVAPAAAVEVTLYSCFCFAFCRGYSCYVCGRFFFFCLTWLAFCLQSRNFYTDFGVVLVRDTNILSGGVHLLSTLCALLSFCSPPLVFPSSKIFPR